MKILNLTPHEINIVGHCVVPPSGYVARCEVSREIIEYVNSIPVTIVKMGKPNLPEREDGVIYIVSRQVAEACPERDDLYIPDDSVRDEQGRIIGVRGLSKIAP